MTDANPADLPADRRDELLGTGGVGVLSFATERDAPPHSVPVSYGYDAETERFYFRLATGPEGGKRPLAGRAVTFVVHGETGEWWWSAVAQGTLADLEGTGADDDSAVLAGLERVDIPLFDVFGAPPRDVSFDFLRLDPERFTAYREG